MNAESRTILKNHYRWCKNNGRDTGWYKKKIRRKREDSEYSLCERNKF